MAVSKKIEGMITQSSWIRKMFEDGIRLKQQFGAENVFDFSLGNPNVQPPRELLKAFLEVAKDERPGVHGYMPNAGYPETRAAVAAQLGREHGVKLGPEHVIMTCGAAGALNVILKTILDPGDEVITPVPFFVEYRTYVDNHNGVTKLVKTKEDFSLDLWAIEEAITERTKAFLINSPNNPTGRVYDEASIRALASILEDKGKKFGRIIHLISDEPYDKIVYDGVKVPSLLKAYRHSLVANSYSKTLSVPGERIGFIAVNPEADGLELLWAASSCATACSASSTLPPSSSGSCRRSSMRRSTWRSTGRSGIFSVTGLPLTATSSQSLKGPSTCSRRPRLPTTWSSCGPCRKKTSSRFPEAASARPVTSGSPTASTMPPSSIPSRDSAR